MDRASAVLAAYNVRRLQRPEELRLATAIDIISNRTGHVYASGTGKSGLVAQKFVGTLRSLGVPASFVHPNDSGHGDLGTVQTGDVAVVVSASGKTIETVEFAKAAGARGATVIGVVNSGRWFPVGQTVWAPVSCIDPFLIPSASFMAAVAILDAIAVEVGTELVHPAGEIGLKLAATA